LGLAEALDDLLCCTDELVPILHKDVYAVRQAV
jgi:hypothetical protein